MGIVEVLFSAVVVVALSCISAILIFGMVMHTFRRFKEIWKGDE
jgi:hypothetical protein